MPGKEELLDKEGNDLPEKEAYNCNWQSIGFDKFK
jgi:hypothetical protein